MPTPALVGAGVGVTATGSAGGYTTINPAAPNNIAANDLLILHVAGRANTSGETVDTPTGFTLISSAGSGTTLMHFWYYRLCDGSEDEQTYAVDGTYIGTGPRIAARIYQFRGTATTSPIESSIGGTNSGTSASPAPASLGPTAGIDRLGIYLVAWNADSSTGRIVGSTGGTWSESILAAEYRATSMSIQLQTAPLAVSGTTISGGTHSIASSLWKNVTFALASTLVSNTPNKFIPVRQAVKRASFY